jgi:predicted secreted protein
MNWISFTASFFITWWITLFAVLPFSVRTQDDDQDVTLGTVPSAPRGPHMLRAVVRTTIVTVIIIGAAFYVTNILGLGIDDIPIVVPGLK